MLFVFGQLEYHRDTSEQRKDPCIGDFCYHLTEEKAAEQVALLEYRMIQVEHSSNLFHIPFGKLNKYGKSPFSSGKLTINGHFQ